MSASLRYKNKLICNHLASQYVVADMTPRVRARIETLRLHVPELNIAITYWSEKFSTLHKNLPDEIPPAHVWQNIERKISIGKTKNKEASWWNNLFLWKATGITTSITSFALMMMLFIFPAQPIADKPTVAQSAAPLISSTPSYLAVMSTHSSQINDESDIRFVVNAYKKTKNAPSRLFVQWSEEQPRSSNNSMHLWAEDRQTGKLSYIGIEPSEQKPWGLTKPSWLAISKSSRLLFTSDSNLPSATNTLFSGPCIQLGSWKQDVT